MSPQGEQPPRKKRPEYKVYRSRPKLPDRLRKDSDLEGLRSERQKKRAAGGDGEMRRYRSGGGGILQRFRRDGGRGGAGGRPWWRWALIGAGVWILISFLAFAISAQIQKTKLDDTGGTLNGGNSMIFGKGTILVLGGDQRGADFSGDKSASDQAPPRADSIMLIRAGGTTFRKLSIPRDSFAEIPGFGEQKINAGFALGDAGSDGNTELMIRTVENFLHIDINHVIVVDFTGFVDFINALGGVDVDLQHKLCGVVAGGRKNGGQSMRLSKGTHTLNGDQALLLSRIRENTCNPRESDIDRAKRQQLVLAGIKNRLTDPLRVPINFIKGPLIGWSAPKAIISDMGAFTMPQLGLAAMLGAGGSTTEVLAPSGSGPGGSLIISEEERRRKVNQFLNG
ncbi:MAG: LCP family protein [Solirubrobacterales bacterium]